MGTYDNIETNNPLLDVIMYNGKKMIQTVILKDEDHANKEEDTDSLRTFNIYDACVQGRASLMYFDPLIEDFEAVGVSTELAQRYLTKQLPIPAATNKAIVKRMSDKYIKDNSDVDGYFIDKNNYYRWLKGYPNLGEPGIKLSKDIVARFPLLELNTKTYIHEYPQDKKALMREFGIVDELIKLYPEAKYLNNFGKGIDPYKVRKSFNYSVVYLPEDGVDSHIRNRYIDLLNKNRVYIQRTVDVHAMGLYSDYYSRFIMFMIVIQAMVDLVNELTDFIIRLELFDIRTIEYFFESNGTKFFPDIPLRYQVKMVKKLNDLISHRGSEVCIVDITKLFGFENIEIFKYYLCKTRTIDKNTGEYKDTGNIEKDYSLKFLKVNMKDNADDIAKDESAYLDYDTVVSKDPTWDGTFAHDYVKKKILEYEFNVVKSKYISIDTVYSLTDVSFELSYFVNMLMFNDVNKDMVLMQIPSLSSVERFKIVDLFVYLYDLMYSYYGVTSTIVTDPRDYLQVTGFNFDADMEELAEYVANKGYTLKDLGVDGFIAPKSGIFSIEQLMNIFFTNKKIYDHIAYEMNNAEDKHIYDIYAHIYDALMITDLQFNTYYIPELDRCAETYTEYLQYHNDTLYNSVIELNNIPDKEDRALAIHTKLSEVTSKMLDIFNSDELGNIFFNLPIESGEFAKNYMARIINMYKSYMTHILDIQTIYKFDKGNKINVIDDIFYEYYFVKKEFFDIFDEWRIYGLHNEDQLIEVLDRMAYFAFYYENTDMSPDDDKMFDINLSMSDELVPEESYELFKNVLRHFIDSYIPFRDKIGGINVSYTKEDRIAIFDAMFNEVYPKDDALITRNFLKNLFDNYILRDKFGLYRLSYGKDDYVTIGEDIFKQPYYIN